MFRNLAFFVIAIGAMICATFGVLIQTIIGKINGMDIKPIPIFLLSLSNTPIVTNPSALGLQLANIMNEINKLKDFIYGYKLTALWSSSDNDKTDCEFLDERFSIDDFDNDARNTIESDCLKFITSNKYDLEIYSDSITYNIHESLSAWEVAGHDFWLTRNGHGAGFWDRLGLDETIGKRLSDSSQSFGECDIYVNDQQTLSI